MRDVGDVVDFKGAKQPRELGEVRRRGTIKSVLPVPDSSVRYEIEDSAGALYIVGEKHIL